MTSVQAEIMRLRAEVARLQVERDQHRNTSREQTRQWEQTDRPRLLNMMFLPENQEDVRNETLSRILDKIQQDILDNHENQKVLTVVLGSQNRETDTRKLLDWLFAVYKW